MPIITGQWTHIEESSRLVGHSSTAVTKQLYRHQIRPTVQAPAA
jgi:hypothetical protein